MDYFFNILLLIYINSFLRFVWIGDEEQSSVLENVHGGRMNSPFI